MDENKEIILPEETTSVGETETQEATANTVESEVQETTTTVVESDFVVNNLDTGAESATEVDSITEEPAATEPAPSKRELRREKKRAKKQARKDKRVRWKAEKKRRRAELKEHYKDAPFLIKLIRLYLVKPFVIATVAFWGLLIAGLLGVGIYFLAYIEIRDYVYENRNEPVEDKQLLYDQSPIDEEGAKRVDAAAPNNADDTWTFCIYFIGADLEDYDENDLSDTTWIQIYKEREERKEAKKEAVFSLLEQYESDLGESGLDLPDFLYYPDKPIAYSETVTEDVVVTDSPGAASLDIGEITASDLSDNIQVVIQTGGATRWENTMVNPNRTQRFLYKGEDFEEVANLPLARSTDPDTLSDFIKFCRNDYPADHMVLILWDHGSGPFGYGVDSIYGGRSMSLKEVRQALASSCKEDVNNPPFDIIGFDACLMSSIEVTHSLNGFADYYILSEETIPGEGWDYSFLQTLSDNPSMSTAAVGREIADKYTDFYMTQNVHLKNYFQHDITIALLDAKKCEELYDAYGELARTQLIDSADDLSVLAGIGRACMSSTHFAEDAYNIYNMVDLGNYADNLAEIYPEESTKISNLIDEAVIYHRENGSLTDSEGISAYIPGYMDSFDSLNLFLRYEYEICEDEDVRDLYFYKIAGCLTDDMKSELKKYTDKEPKTLDPTIFHAYEKADPVIDDDGFAVPVSDDLASMIQAYDFELYLYDEEWDTTISYGSDELAYLDGEGNIRADFDGSWIFLDGVPLATEVVSSTSSKVDYLSRVNYNGDPAYLLFTYDRDSEEFTIKGIRLIPEEESSENYLISSNDDMELKNGDRITPVYKKVDYSYNSESEEWGKTVKFNSFTKIKEEKLDSGMYLGMITIYDQRGDSYFSAVIDNKIASKKVKERKVDENFYGRGY